MHRQRQKSPQKSILTLILILSITHQISHTSASTSQQQSPHHHKHRHKHQFLTINSNQIHDIREAFDDYRNTINKDNKIDFEELQPLRHHHKKHSHHETHEIDNNSIQEDETMPAIHQHQYGLGVMNRHKRLNGGKTTTTTTTTTPVPTSTKTIDNYDDEYDDDESDANRRVSDDAHVQTRSSQTQTSNHISNKESLTSYKINNLSTREGVDKSFQEMQRSNQHDMWSHVMQNIRRTKIDGLCRWPNKKLMETPYHHSKIYMPRKYVIYQCSDDTSCCGSAEKTCVAKKYEELTYVFHVRYINHTDAFEPLKVRNHTECECIYRNQQRPSRQPPASNIWTTTTRRSQVQIRTTTTRPTTTSRPTCKCPQNFESVFTNEGKCECKCERGGAECRLMYEGKEGFTISDQRCIRSRDCTQPHCLYGTYQMDLGRCPDRNDKIRGLSRQPNHHNHHHHQQQQQQQRL
ncbi:uncharacterized protein [Chironomus tepperi]|uniref:uncharacterized protein n=1 Tax=Chironomus tepperi TaxID=113505 RepID=UPI00391F401F